MSTHKGLFYERLAQQYLEQQGLRFLSRNFRCRYGEIDLIFRHDSSIVFVEVRYRKTPDPISPAESINPQKRRRLLHTAEYYLQQRILSGKLNCRFDAVLIQGQPEMITWIQNAFILTEFY